MVKEGIVKDGLIDEFGAMLESEVQKKCWRYRVQSVGYGMWRTTA